MDRHQPSTRSFIPQSSPVFGSVPCESPMRLSICSTTGSRFELSVPQGETLEGLRRRLSQRLRVPKDRLVFLHKETQMNAGKLVDQGVSDGSKLTLVLAVEAGLTPQPLKTDHTMIQALENLTETQVSDFLSGRSPLTLALGIGAHLMYVQLQLASQNAVGQHHHGNRSGGKVHSGKSGSSRVARPYPSPTHPSYVSHPCLPLGTPRCPAPPPPFHRTPVIRRPHPGPALHDFSPPHTPQPRASPHPHTPSPAPSPLSSHGPPPCLPSSPAAPLCPPHVICSSPAPPSPTPAAPYPEESCASASPLTPGREPGAVIESFVSHSPGVFSGTFSGTLHPVSQSGISHPRRGIATILQILNDLLSATRHHQGAPASLCQLRGPGPASPSCPLTSDPPPHHPRPLQIYLRTQHHQQHGPTPPAGQTPSKTHRAVRAGDGGCPQTPSSSEENRALRCKLESLQLLMYQRRLRRRARRGAHPLARLRAPILPAPPPPLVAGATQSGPAPQQRQLVGQRGDVPGRHGS
ncbi:LOW QUALITY PROTEIN: midnolin-like [Hypomesus transpacificus]|uniref:LOW QUALITY PROTEIN: midnolin-like n=1 Tax=Hypomesus transpacificus TaxID=137520 RepID=UPI001F07A54A|nr:LOW QUALITY PROTEIN: midnolin-like [Hypomesus transpacificus]